MTSATLIWCSIWRDPIRTLLLVVTIAVAFLVYGVIASFDLTAGSVRGVPNRLVTQSRINFTETLPLADVDHIRRIRGVTAATNVNWFGGYYRDQARGFVAVSAVDPASFLQVYASDMQLSSLQRSTFVRGPRTMIVSREVASRFGWRLGQRIPLMSYIYTKPDGSRSWDFIVAGIFDAPPQSQYRNSAVIHYDYINQTTVAERNRIGWVVFLTENAALNDSIAQSIDRQFENSSDATTTQDAVAFGRAFVRQYGDLLALATAIIAAAFAAAIIIVCTTASTAIIARLKEISLLKTLGFSSQRIASLTIAEHGLICAAGAAIGLLAAGYGVHLLAKGTNGAFGALQMPVAVSLWGALLTGAVTACVSATPVLVIYRTTIAGIADRRRTRAPAADLTGIRELAMSGAAAIAHRASLGRAVFTISCQRILEAVRKAPLA